MMMMRDRWAVLRNEVCRRAMYGSLALAPQLVKRSLRRRIARHPRRQESLRARYGITPESPILRWGEQVERAVEAWAATQPDARFAYTSGTTNRPKKIPITPARLRRIKRGSWEAAVQAGEAHGVHRPTLFVLAALKRDASLSSMMLDDGAHTPYTEGLVMPSKYLWERAVEVLLDRYGPTACRLWLMVLANPGIVYSTNPSTLAVFLERLEGSWSESSALVRDFVRDRGSLPAVAIRVFRRVAAPGWARRARTVAEASSSPPAAEYLDGLRVYACWDGGYVAPFLERIRRFLPAPRFVHAPMYSMSTETVQTQTYYEDGRVHFLPLAPGVLYEFLPEGSPDAPSALLPARALERGKSYAMVVSDGYGLRRYQTDDLFLCQERVRGLPDLRFLRRRGLAYSFTGEKLTGEQVTAAFGALREQFPQLRERGVQLTCLPSLEVVPHYRLVLAWPGEIDGSLAHEALVAAFEASLGEQNEEFVTKRESDRLGPTRVESLPYDALAQRLQGGTPLSPNTRAWETQFKLLPLYTRTWEQTTQPEAVAS